MRTAWRQEFLPFQNEFPLFQPHGLGEQSITLLNHRSMDEIVGMQVESD